MQKLSETAAFVRLVQISREQLLHANRDHQGADGESQAELMDGGTDTASKASSDQEQGEEAGHGLSIQRRAALVVALTADWLDRQRLAVVPMVVMDRRAAAVRAREVMRALERAKTNGTSDLVMRFPLGRPVEVIDRHGSGRLEFRQLALALVKNDQRRTQFEVGQGGLADGKVTDRGLLAVASGGDLGLGEAPSFQVRKK